MSVLLPVRDAVATLAACLDSLAAQTLADHEIVAVDDGSSDGSGELLRERAVRDPRLVLIPTPALGLVPALTRAIAEARAPLVARMDADDLADAERLRLQVERLEQDADVDVLGCRVRAIPGAAGGSVGAGMAAYVEWQNGLTRHETMRRERYVESPLAHPSVAMRRAALVGLGGYRDFPGPEDYELWLRAFDAGLRFAKLEATLVEWRDGPDRLTRSSPRYAPERFLEVKLESLARGPLAKGRPVVIWGAGRIGKSWARALAARGRLTTAFVEVDPRKLGQRIHGAPVFAMGDPLPEGALHLAAVGQPGARDRIRAEAARLGLVEERDFVAVA